MKRPLIYLALLLLMPLTAWANLPAGTTVYLNTTDFGGGHTCYYIYFSGKGTWYLMTEVPNRPGYYSYTYPESRQQNVRFGYYKTDGGTCVSSTSTWDDVTKITNSDADIPNAQNTCYHPTSNNKGTWEDGSWSADEITDVTYQIIESNCVDSTATIEVTVTLTGSTATLKLSGPMFANERLLPKCATPYIFKYYTSGKSDAPAQMTLTASACSNTAGTSVNNTKSIQIARPQINCTDSISTDSICNTIATTTLSATREADSIQWYDKNKQPCFTNQKTITVPVVEGALYTVDYFSTSISSHNNLMANGSFEDGYTGFYSDYLPISKNSIPVLDPYNVYGGEYDNGSAYGKYYAIMTNANRFWPGDGINNGYADITAHEGQYFLVADATDVGYAWKATTTDNPNLKLVKDQQYIFSYWAAYPNLPDQFDDPSAVLQFAIEYDDEQSTHHIEALGSPYQLGNQTPLYDWYQQTTIWTAPCNSSNVSIGVKDLTQSAEGNDFCLDDIIFQAITGEQKVFAHRDVFSIVTKECGTTIVDTICLGETYSQHGFNVTPQQAGDTVVTREEPTEPVVLKLHVEAPVSVTASAIGAICNHAGGTVVVPFTILSGLPATYSMTADNPDVTPVTDANMPTNNRFVVDIPNPIVSGTRTLTFTFDNRVHRCNDQQLVVTLTFVECKGLMDTTCVGQPYNKGGFSHPADQPGTFKLENGTTDTLYLTVLINPDVQVNSITRSECNITSANIDVPYTIVAGDNLSYTLTFDAVLPAMSGQLTGEAFHLTVPQAGLNRQITGTLSCQYMNRCVSTSTFTIRVTSGTITVYRKWDNVLFVDNHLNQYIFYQWYRDGKLIEGATDQSLYTGADEMLDDGHEYYVVVTSSDGTTDQSCSLRFNNATPSAPFYPAQRPNQVAQRTVYRVGPDMKIIETTYSDGTSQFQKVIVK